ncbi:MAG: putative Mariner Mos1 transposase [Streblomastix strix]|uniref:Putative Mariner Mos1 transposase n=1 Tax=Streblomastix strix TaxID=222440 RepID=A0A5J4X8S9_9EUKA|nr:MAG: putative Mariner Mos1 transposase [Streblomastix strix]
MTVTLGEIDYLRFRVLVEHKLRLCESNEIIFHDLREIYGTISPECVTIRKWRAEFNKNKTLVVHPEHPGRPKITGLGPEVTKVIQDNPYISLRRLADTFHHDKKTIRRIIDEETEYIRVCLRFVPHILNNSNKIQRMDYAKDMKKQIKQFEKSDFRNIVTGDETWIYLRNYASFVFRRRGEEPLEKPRQAIGDEKRMFTVFFSGEGIQFIHMLPKMQTMDSEIFIKEIIQPLDEQYQQQRSKDDRNVWIHFDNARVHTSKKTQTCNSRSIFTQLKHPAYSPDISPCDFFLFGVLKQELKGKLFRNEDEAEQAVTRILNEIHPSEIQRAFRNWIYRLDYIIAHDGNYYNKSKW